MIEKRETIPNGFVMDIQPFSVNDGNGIRTTVFLAGCPLRCQWCSNPEGFSQRELVGWHQRKCIGCGKCAEVCPEGIGICLSEERFADRINRISKNDRCTACGACVKVCPVGARTFMVRQMDAGEVIEKIQKHRLFYMQSGGGVTFSGGEATMQPGFLRCLAERIYDLGYDMAIETSGYFDIQDDNDTFTDKEKRNAEDIRWTLEHMDMIFMDLKIFDDEKHRLYTGVSNKKILKNIKQLGKLHQQKLSAGKSVPAADTLCNKDDHTAGPRVVIRIPVIGGVNDDEENIRCSAAFVHENAPEAEMELLPYHEFGKIKYEALGMAYDRPAFSRPSKEHMEYLKSIVEDEGVKTADFR